MNPNTLRRSLSHRFAIFLPLPLLGQFGESTGILVGPIESLTF